MGRIKSTLIKKTAVKLMEGDQKFSEDFDYNKNLLRGTMPSKSIQNKVAGYIARLVRMQNSQ